MKTWTLAAALLAFPHALLLAQPDPPDFGISFSGFVRTDVMVDTRQTVSFREGHFLLYPSAVMPDSDGADINARANFNILSIQTRLLGKISGPDAWGAKTSGLLEGEFFGMSDADVNGFRLRHAYVLFDWRRVSLLVGQTWHPMFVVEMFLAVVSFNTGAPFQPFSRNPQIRLSCAFRGFKLIAAAASQRDFQSPGPDRNNQPVFSSSYLRNAAFPNMHIQLQCRTGENLLGVGVDYKKLVPRLATAKNRATHAAIGSVAALGYLKLVVKPFVVKAEGAVGGNLADMLMLGGYAVTASDPISGAESYSAIRCLSCWGELSAGTTIEAGLFAGYTKNRGAARDVVGAYYTRGGDIGDVFRISPRLQWNSGKARVAAELEYTSARYGFPDGGHKGRVERLKTAANIRLLTAVYYFF